MNAFVYFYVSFTDFEVFYYFLNQLELRGFNVYYKCRFMKTFLMIVT